MLCQRIAHQILSTRTVKQHVRYKDLLVSQVQKVNTEVNIKRTW